MRASRLRGSTFLWSASRPFFRMTRIHARRALVAELALLVATSCAANEERPAATSPTGPRASTSSEQAAPPSDPDASRSGAFVTGEESNVEGGYAKGRALTQADLHAVPYPRTPVTLWKRCAATKDEASEEVVLRVVVLPNGRAESVSLLTQLPDADVRDAVKDCAMGIEYVPALDASGRAIRGTTDPIHLHIPR